MKRHLALINFSREHHNALILAQILKKDGPNYKGFPNDDEGKRTYTLSFHKTELIQHFQHEEEILFSFVLERTHQLVEQTAILIAEHKKLKKLILQLQTTGDLKNALNKIGVLLEKHVRFEERIYFPKVQEIFSALEMNELLLLLSPDQSNSKEV